MTSRPRNPAFRRAPCGLRLPAMTRSSCVLRHVAAAGRHDGVHPARQLAAEFLDVLRPIIVVRPVILGGIAGGGRLALAQKAAQFAQRPRQRRERSGGPVPIRAAVWRRPRASRRSPRWREARARPRFAGAARSSRRRPRSAQRHLRLQRPLVLRPLHLDPPPCGEGRRRAKARRLGGVGLLAKPPPPLEHVRGRRRRHDRKRRRIDPRCGQRRRTFARDRLAPPRPAPAPHTVAQRAGRDAVLGADILDRPLGVLVVVADLRPGDACQSWRYGGALGGCVRSDRGPSRSSPRKQGPRAKIGCPRSRAKNAGSAAGPAADQSCGRMRLF